MYLEGVKTKMKNGAVTLNLISAPAGLRRNDGRRPS
jgi:hypothetical protein